MSFATPNTIRAPAPAPAPAAATVGRGVDVAIDNLKFRVAPTGNISLQVSTVSGATLVTGRDVSYYTNILANFNTAAVSVNATTTPTYIRASQSFNVADDMQVAAVKDNTTGNVYRVTALYSKVTAPESIRITIERM